MSNDPAARPSSRARGPGAAPLPSAPAAVRAALRAADGEPINLGERTLLLHPAGCKFSPVAAVEFMTWAEAQQDGHRAFGNFKRFVCCPPAYPPIIDAHQREAMQTALRRAIEGGALALLLVPPSTLPSEEIDGSWNLARTLIENASRMGVVRTQEIPKERLRILRPCPKGIAAHLDAHAPNYRVEGLSEIARGGELQDPYGVLAETGGRVSDPYAVVGFAGSGAYAVVPWSEARVSNEDVSGLLALLRDLAELRSAEAKRRERESAARKAEFERSNRDPALKAVPGKSRGRGRRGPVAPFLHLRGPKLYVVPLDEKSCVFQRWEAGAPRPLMSLPLQKGAFAVATCLLSASNFVPGAPEAVALEDVREALRGFGVPAGRRKSISVYISQVNRALEKALGPSIPKRAIRIERGAGAVSIGLLQRCLSVLGGARVTSIRGTDEDARGDGAHGPRAADAEGLEGMLRTRAERS